MNFCNVCENMYYMRINEESKEQLQFYCRMCGNVDEILNKSSLCLSEYSEDNNNDSIIQSVNKYTKFDPTLPHIHNIQCPNNECISNKEDKEDKEDKESTDETLTEDYSSNESSENSLSTNSSINLNECDSFIIITTYGENIICSPIISFEGDIIYCNSSSRWLASSDISSEYEISEMCNRISNILDLINIHISTGEIPEADIPLMHYKMDDLPEWMIQLLIIDEDAEYDVDDIEEVD